MVEFISFSQGGSMTTLTERQLRERDYYEKYSSFFDLNQNIDFSPVDGPLTGREFRSWNSYWRSFELALREQKKASDPLHLLDFGCGPGENAIRFARAGFRVTGFDICEKNIDYCQKLFQKNGWSDKGKFLVTVAEQLPFPDKSFDLIVGIDILHHVDIPLAIREIKRVLKPGGLAVFREPIEVPLFEKIRNTKLIKYFFPNDASLSSHITEDERKLNEYDLMLIRQSFPEIEIENFYLFSRLDKFFRKQEDKTVSLLEMFDHFLFKMIPPLRKFGGAVIFKLRSENDLHGKRRETLQHVV